jgi:hypothetical protein
MSGVNANDGGTLEMLSVVPSRPSPKVRVVTEAVPDATPALKFD